MSIFEFVGTTWIILTSLLATIAIIWLAVIGFTVTFATRIQIVSKTEHSIATGRARTKKTVQVEV